MKIITKKEVQSLAALLIAVLLLEFFFGGLSLHLKNSNEKTAQNVTAGAILALQTPTAGTANSSFHDDVFAPGTVLGEPGANPSTWVNPDSVIGAPAPSWSNPALDPFGGPGPTINAGTTGGTTGAAGGATGGATGGTGGVGGSAAGQAGAQAGAQAASCAAPAGGVAVPHQQCQTPATTNGTPCGPIYTPGGVIQGVCAGACCTAAGFTSAQSSIGSFMKALGLGVAISGITGLVGQLFTGGSGGDYGGYDGAWAQYSQSGDSSHLLDFGSDTLTSGGSGQLGGFDVAFGDDDDKSTDLEYGTSIVQQAQNTGADRNGDGVVTSFEKIQNAAQTQEVAEVTGDSDVEREFNSSAFGDADFGLGDRLSLADLEREAEEARRREALLNEQQGAAQTGTIRDYRSSSISQSGGDGDGTDENTIGTEASWWQKLLLFLGGLLGL